MIKGEEGSVSVIKDQFGIILNLYKILVEHFFGAKNKSAFEMTTFRNFIVK